MEPRFPQPIKYSVHKSVTTKVFPPRSENQTPRLVRISVTDGDATDSSDDDEGGACRRVRTHVTEVRLVRASFSEKAKKRGPPAAAEPPAEERRYRGVRRRPWGKDECSLSGYFNLRVPSPLILDEMRWKEEDLGDGVYDDLNLGGEFGQVDLGGDFDWDVDQFFDDPISF
ncbi:Ethylene-responsive transcription factor CRF4 [Striga hermonthica]|uniref:Ethylene-responsive transcription factor CRF4 n=1 Tax=Striga hermonthica TaxID=68872 RepID=A0A9N7NC09_STRHE|nr:Ethylene-responsive transcription factor CRF4 [Striga hermonthica]